MRVAVLGTGRMATYRTKLLIRDSDVEEVVLAGHDRAHADEAAATCGARGHG
jgi:hypothetical protein